MADPGFLEGGRRVAKGHKEWDMGRAVPLPRNFLKILLLKLRILMYSEKQSYLCKYLFATVYGE